MNKQSGFAIVEAILAIVVVAGLAGGGYVVWHSHQKAPNPATAVTTSSGSSYTSPPATTQNAPAVNSPADLNAALTTLNQTDVNASTADSTQLGTQTQGF